MAKIAPITTPVITGSQLWLAVDAVARPLFTGWSRALNRRPKTPPMAIQTMKKTTTKMTLRRLLLAISVYTPKILGFRKSLAPDGPFSSTPWQISPKRRSFGSNLT